MPLCPKFHLGGCLLRDIARSEQKMPKNAMVENPKFFDLIFRGLVLPFFRWTEGTQTFSQHPIFICRQENGILDAFNPLNFVRSKGHQKWPKQSKNAKISPFFLFRWTCMIKIMTNFVWKKFQKVWRQKVLIKQNFPFFTENPWFFRKNFPKA